MMKLYVETSVVSFWFDQHERNRDKRRATRRLLLSCRKGLHEAFVSEVVFRELRASREPFRSRDLGLLGTLQLPSVVFDPEAHTRIFQAYQADPMLTTLPAADLEHMATYTVSNLEALVTLNLRHLANQVMLNRVRSVNHAQGFQKEVIVASPQAFLPPGTV